MLPIFLAFLIFGGIIWLFDLPFKYKIKSSTSVESSLKARRRLRVFRRFWSVLLIAVFCIVIIVLDIYNGKSNSLGNDIGLIVGFAIYGGWARLRGNVQANSKDEYLSKYKDKGYILYLRSFESDFYSKNPEAHTFESDLILALEKRGKNVCAIGMTKELDAPYGATRVYVSDESWQSDVKELMQYAEAIFIRMSDRESCIWEITQSVEMLQKTCFFIDNKEAYNNVKNALQGSIPFPEFGVLLQNIADEGKEKNPENTDSVVKSNKKSNKKPDKNAVKLSLIIKNNGFDVTQIDETTVFIEDVLDVDRLSFKRKTPNHSADGTPTPVVKKKKNWLKIFFVSIFVIIAIVLVIKLITDIYINHEKNGNETTGFIWAIVLIVIAIVFFATLIILNRRKKHNR